MRKTKAQLRTEVVYVRLTPADKAALRRLTRLLRESEASVVARAVRLLEDSAAVAPASVLT